MAGRPYRDRREAGRYLAGKPTDYAARPDVLVLALPRGGVPVAYEVARALNAPLDVSLDSKLGVPGHEELATGASMWVATAALRKGQPARTVVAVPIAAPSTCEEFQDEVRDSENQ